MSPIAHSFYANGLVPCLTSVRRRLVNLLDNIQPTPDDFLTPEYNFGMISEVLSELEFNHPELFENVPLSEEETEPEFISIENELTDDQLIKSMKQYEEEMKATFDSYDYLLENEVSAFLLH